MRGACLGIVAIAGLGLAGRPALAQPAGIDSDVVLVQIVVEDEPAPGGALPAIWVDPFVEVALRREGRRVVVRSALGVPWNGAGRWTRSEDGPDGRSYRLLAPDEARAILEAVQALPLPQWRARPNRPPGLTEEGDALEIRVGGTSTVVALPSTDERVLRLLRVVEPGN